MTDNRGPAPDYRSLDLSLRTCGSELLIEARGPDGEWAEAPTNVTFEPEWDHGAAKEYLPLNISKIGDLLGKSLFPGPVLDVYTAVLARVLAQPKQRLRLRLHFLGAALVHAPLPWESTRISGYPLALDPRQTIVRTIDLPEPANPQPSSGPPYRILVVGSQPAVAAVLDIDLELGRLTEIFKPLIDQRLVEVTFERDPTLARIRHVLATQEFHIFHYVGHSHFDETGKGVLYIADEQKRGILLGAEELTRLLLRTSVQLAFLSTGHGIVGGSRPGVAEAILRAGVPFVVAHNYAVTDATAIDFADSFYGELVRSNSLEQAVLVGRQHLSESDSHEERRNWANPILIERAAGDQFWTGDLAYQIDTFIHEGRLISQASRAGRLDPEAFSERLQVLLDYLGGLSAPADQLEARQLVAEAREAMSSAAPEQASQKLSEASTYVLLAVREQERRADDLRRESKERRAVLVLVLLWLAAIGLVSFLVGDRWTPDLRVPVVALPVSVIVWSLVGGVATMLQAFVGTSNARTRRVTMDWLIWRPVVGLIMGSVVYLIVSAGVVSLGQTDLATLNTRNAYLLWAVAFIGGFSDKFAVFVFDHVVRTLGGLRGNADDGEQVSDETSQLGRKSNGTASSV